MRAYPVVLPGPHQTLEGLAHGRDNSFNLMRMVAASAVIVSHAYALPRGSWQEPFIDHGLTLGGLAVSVFFALSGFLISASFDRHPALVEFGLPGRCGSCQRSLSSRSRRRSSSDRR